MKEYNFLLFKPDALERELVGKIVERFINNGFTIEMIDYRQVNEHLISQHYEAAIEQMGDKFIERLKEYFENKYVIIAIIGIENENAILLSRQIIGIIDPIKSKAGTIRFDFGNDSLETALKENRCVKNLVHASDDNNAFNREILLWFGKDILEKYS